MTDFFTINNVYAFLTMTAFMQRAAPQVHIGQHCIDCAVGNHSLTVFLSGETITCLTFHSFAISDNRIEDYKLVGKGEQFYFGVLVNHLCGIRHILESANQIEVVQGAESSHFCLHLNPFACSELLVPCKDFFAMLQYFVTVVNSSVNTAPVKNIHTGVWHTIYNLNIHVTVPLGTMIY